jgi:CRP/FNR family transcriptional regulator, cyclic AMP receptor protein
VKALVVVAYSERQGQEDRHLRAGEGSRGRNSGNRRFLWGRVFDRTTAASVNRLRYDGVIVRITKADLTRVIHEEPAFAELFIAHLLARNSRVEEDLVDQLFNSSEKRLARILLVLANFGKEGRPEPIIAKISQETLAEMMGTTRSRVSFFMNKFRELGLIDYKGDIAVHSSLLNVVLHDQPQIRR